MADVPPGALGKQARARRKARGNLKRIWRSLAAEIKIKICRAGCGGEIVLLMKVYSGMEFSDHVVAFAKIRIAVMIEDLNLHIR